jgi:TRAP-type C4-dicarboxylate transport system permease small subunit
MIRRFLDALYLASGYLAAAFLVGIAFSIVVQMICRFSGVTFDSTEIAGFCLAASTFLGLAYTFRTGGHVRITLTLDRLPARARRAIEVFNCLVAGAGILFVTWNLLALVLQSFRYHDVSPGLLAIPFWMPQAGAALGVVILSIALLDELVSILRGRTPRYDVAEATAESHFE